MNNEFIKVIAYVPDPNDSYSISIIKGYCERENYNLYSICHDEDHLICEMGSPRIGQRIRGNCLVIINKLDHLGNNFVDRLGLVDRILHKYTCSLHILSKELYSNKVNLSSFEFVINIQLSLLNYKEQMNND